MVLPNWDVEGAIQKSDSLRVTLIIQKNAEQKKSATRVLSETEIYCCCLWAAVSCGMCPWKRNSGRQRGLNFSMLQLLLCHFQSFHKEILNQDSKKKNINIHWMVWPVWELPRRFIQLLPDKPPRHSSAGLAEDRDSPRSEKGWLDSWQTVNCCCNCTVAVCDKLPHWKPVKI